MLQLRRYIPSDAEAVVTWVGDETAFRRWSADRYDHYPITAEDINSNYDTAGKNGWFFPYTMTDDGVPVGHLIMRYPYENKSIVRMGFIIVDPKRRGQGLGRRMIALAKEEASAKFGAVTATLGVFANNEPAHRCYLAAGFKEIPADKEEYFHIFGEDWLCIEMSAEL